MPVFVAAVKQSRRGRTRYWSQSSQGSAYSPSEVELSHSASEAHTASVASGSSVSEEGWIRRNLKTFFTDFESDRERAIIRNTSPPRRRVNSHCSMEEVPQSPQDVMEEERISPMSTPVLIPSGIEKSFKARRTFDSRQRDVEDIIRKHPHKIPIIVERSKNEKHLGILDKSKFLVPEELTMSQLCTIIRRRLQLNDSHAFYLMVNRRSMASASTTLAEIYRNDKDKDGFLYITYASQEMFG